MSQSSPNRSRRTATAGKKKRLGRPPLKAGRPKREDGPPYASGAEIRRQREEAGYSQAEYGAILYYSRSIVAQWEREERRCPRPIHEYLTLLISHRATRQARLELFGVETREPREVEVPAEAAVS